MKDTTLLEKTELEVMACGGWGTINARSVSAAAALADYVGSKHALLCHSADAAYEALLRHFGAAHGDRVVVGETCESADALVPVCVGAMPAFSPVCDVCGMIAPDALDSLLGETENVRCVVIDLLPESIDTYPLARVREICTAHKVPVILNAGGCFSLRQDEHPLAAYADAVLYSLEEGSEIYAGKGGLIVTNDTNVYAGAFAYHNCGRGFGDGCSLNVDAIVGGDLRVTEWTAAAAEIIVQSGEFFTPAPRKLVHMASQPVFSSDYAKKMTGI
ncbi:MAG: DegT/DnrJ/EryC1/StrS family aminotransferase [Clostridia bacterium]|nr:DegT/DnrJ/EryC1/StrS family aminotransferase [Clostridia bacterium]